MHMTPIIFPRLLKTGEWGGGGGESNLFHTGYSSLSAGHDRERRRVEWIGAEGESSSPRTISRPGGLFSQGLPHPHRPQSSAYSSKHSRWEDKKEGIRRGRGKGETLRDGREGGVN